MEAELLAVVRLMWPPDRLPTLLELELAGSHLDHAEAFLDEIRRTQCGGTTACPPTITVKLRMVQEQVTILRAQLAARIKEISATPTPTGSTSPTATR